MSLSRHACKRLTKKTGNLPQRHLDFFDELISPDKKKGEYRHQGHGDQNADYDSSDGAVAQPAIWEQS
jgi:hypothetical protein